MDSFSKRFFEFAQSVTSESRFRLAPTPSGFLHLGNALNFTLNWLAAKCCSVPAANILLRIDDLDTDRNKPEYQEDIFATLQWLRLDWDADPSTNLPILQSAHLPKYHLVLNRLRQCGLLFACQKSRRDLMPFPNSYPIAFRDQGLSLDAADVAWRIKTPPGFPLPDFVVRRRDGIPAYQVASFADDLHYGITHVVRGADLENSTAAQQYLAQVLSADNFLKIKFLHHPLVLDETGGKLSKSTGSTSLKSIREAGQGPEKVFETVGDWLALEGKTATELLASMRNRLA